MTTPRTAHALALIAAAQARIAGMQAENQSRQNQGYALAYDEEAFFDEATRLEQIAGLHDQLEEPQIAQDDYRLNKLELEEARQQVTLLSGFATKIAEQIPEKPDHWSSCSQCEHNSSDAQDIIEALAATKDQ